MKTIAIFAVDQESGIGKNGTIPWHIPEDFKHFKQTTMGHTVIMGSKTYYDLRDNYSKNGKILPGRRCVVISSKDSDGNIFFYNNLEECINECKKYDSQCFIIGGASLFHHVFSSNIVIDEVIISSIYGKYDCDVFLQMEIKTDYLKVLDKTFIIKEKEEKNNFSIIKAVRS